MSAKINNLARCEIIRYLLAENNNAAEIHRQVCEIYVPNVMNDNKVRQ